MTEKLTKLPRHLSELAERERRFEAGEEEEDPSGFAGHLVRAKRDTDVRHRKEDIAALAAIQAARPKKPPPGRPPLRTTRAAELSLAEDERTGVAGDDMVTGPGGAYRRRRRVPVPTKERA